MSKEKQYTLSILVEHEGIKELEQCVKKALGKHLDNIRLLVKERQPKVAEVTIIGGCETIDACHVRLNRKVLNIKKFARLTDELGQKLRSEAYPLLADLEQELRSFIQEAMISSLGFSWWEQIGLDKIRERAEEISKRSRGKIPHHHLEFTEFEDLVELIAGELAYWKGERLVTVEDLQKLLAKCSTIDEMRKSVEQKTRKKSLWDSVFARFFEQKEEWIEAKEDLLKTVVPIRHKVMHHRPIQLHELKSLKDATEKVKRALHARKRRPQREEMETIRQSLMSFAEIAWRQQEQIIQAVQPMLEYQARMQEILRPMLEQMRPMLEWQKEMQENMRPMLKLYAEMAKTLKPLLEQRELFLKNIGKNDEVGPNHKNQRQDQEEDSENKEEDGEEDSDS